MKNHQKKFLKARAHTLRPVVIVGSAGLTDGVINEVNLALDKHELIKVKVNADDRKSREAMIDEISSLTDAFLVQSIGQMAILYRANPKMPVIQLPK